jgi:hypothetical protein
MTASVSLSYTVNTITGTTLSSSSFVNGYSSATWTFTIPISNDILSGGKIKITIPYWE